MSQSTSGLGSPRVSPKTLYYNFRTHFMFPDAHEKRLAFLEEQVKSIDKVAEETARTTRRMDAMEGSVHRFAGALESFLGRIHIDDKLRLVPDSRRISPGPLFDDKLLVPNSQRSSPGPPRISPSSSAPLELPMDEDDTDFGNAASAPDTPSDVNADPRMVEVVRVASGSSLQAPAPQPPVPIAASDSAPQPPLLPPTPVAAPTVNVIPATPQGSQTLTNTATSAVLAPIPSPPPPAATEGEGFPRIRLQNRSRSRTPAVALLGVQEGRTTRARSRSKTPI
jgi:hypothetical protein